MIVPSLSGHQVLLQLAHRKWARSPTANRSAVAAAAIPATPASPTGAKPASWTPTQRDKVVSICVYPVHASLRQVFVQVPSFARGHYEFVGLSWTKWKTGFDPQGMRNGIEREAMSLSAGRLGEITLFGQYSIDFNSVSLSTTTSLNVRRSRVTSASSRCPEGPRAFVGLSG